MARKAATARKETIKRDLGTLSMTGYGRGKASSKDVEVGVEVKSVNNRYLDLSLRLPRAYSRYEHEVRQHVAERLQRGRVDIYVERSALSEAAVKLSFHQGLFDSYYELARGICERKGRLGEEGHTRLVLDILRQREILELSDELVDGGAEGEVLKRALSQALDELCKMRALEGARLAGAVARELDELSFLRAEILGRAEISPEIHKQRLQARLKDIAPDLLADENRIYQEAVLLAEKIDISEELTRLESHFDQFRGALAESRQGRKLDFLAQEIIREFNTIGSKSPNSEVRSLVVQAKVTIDKIREQVQNIE